VPVVHNKDNAKLIEELETDAKGRFQQQVPLRQAKDYFMLKVAKKGKQTITRHLLTLNDGQTHAVSFSMIPAKPTPQQQKIIDKKQQKQMIEKEAEKMKDTSSLLPGSPQNQQQGNPYESSHCSYSPIPTTVYVENLEEGYNDGSASGSNVYTGYIDFDDYIAGVVDGEIGFMQYLETKKAQAVAARTFSMVRHESGSPVNVGQAYSYNTNSSSVQSSNETSGEVVLYNNGLIEAKYSARCNGDYTQNATEGVWAPYQSCNTSGTYRPYLLSVSCAGHINCSQTSESPCCQVQISTTGNPGYIFGHGVGMCQRGIESYGQYGWDYQQMLTHFYTNVCVANTGSSSGNCPGVQTINQTLSGGAHMFKASDHIDADNTIQNGADVTYQSGDYVKLKKGFHAEQGVSFEANTDGCQ
jgi:peptidoglycan hydrolase-like amidase